MKILLIAGHGDGDSGAVALGYQEANLTREIVKYIQKYLSAYAETTIADTSRDWFTYLKTHTYNFRPYGYVLEVHFNSGANNPSGNGRTTGTEIYVTTQEQGITVEQDILKNMQAIGFTNRGVKRKNFSVISKIRAQGVSAALLELAFIDDKDDMDLYQAKKEEIGQAVADGIAEGFGLTKDEGGNGDMDYEALKAAIDDLSARVYALEHPMIYNYIDSNMPDWARPTIQKLVDKGFLKGDAVGELGLTYDMMRMFVVNDRAGLYGPDIDAETAEDTVAQDEDVEDSEE